MSCSTGVSRNRDRGWSRGWLALMLGMLVCGAVAEPTIPDEVEPEVFSADALEIIDPWASAAIGDAHSAKVFFEFRNRSERTDRLLAARSPIAKSAAVFKFVSAPTGLRTVPAIEIPAGGLSFELSRHGYYIELSGLELPLTMGKRFPLELTFADAGRLRIMVTSRFHSPKLTRRIREAARAGDTAELRRLRDSP